MNESGADKRVLRFAAFEADLGAGELRKRGAKIRLPGQSFQVLQMLLERPGEVVTRGELRHKLWPADTFVDFDQNLNAAVKRLRRALNDSADSPRLIETLPRRGYRLIVPVSATDQQDQASIGNNSVDPRRALSDPTDSITRRETKGWLHRWSVLIPVSAAVVLIALLLGIALWSNRSRRPVQEPAMRQLTSDSGLTFQPCLSSDGNLMTYASDRSGEGNLDIWLKQIAGGEPIRLTQHPADDYEPAFSPDGSRITFRSDRNGGGIYEIPALGGDEKLIATQGRRPRFSPDGHWIAYWAGPTGWGRFTSDAGKLYVVASSGGLPRQIQTDFSDAGSSVWSPDGKHLLFLGVREPSNVLVGESLDWWVTPVAEGVAVKTGAFDLFRGQGFPISFPALVPAPSQWIEDQILFSARLGDSVNLWQVAISPKNWQLVGPVRRLSSGSGVELHPSASANGRLVFASLRESLNIWALPMNPDQGKVLGEIQQLTDTAALNYHPSISTDGRKVVFTSSRSGNEDIWMKDLETGKEAALAATPHQDQHPEISCDGSKVAFTSGVAPQKPVIQVLAVQDSLAQKTYEERAWVWDWSPDGGKVILTIGIGPGSLHFLDLNSGEKTEIPQPPNYDLYQTNFSSDGQWLVFEVVDEMYRSGISVVPLRDERPPRESEWITVTDGSVWDDKPRWSPDGNTIYFVSDRDGFLCLWGQRVDSGTKRPLRSPFDVYHFHNARRSLANQGFGFLEISVARDKIVFSLDELAGNIWTTELANP